MLKLILLPALGTTDDAPVFATARAAGRLFDSHLTALHVRPDMRDEIAALAVPDFGVAAGLERMIADIEAHADATEQAARAAWTDFLAASNIPPRDHPGHPGMSGGFVTAIGRLPDQLARHGRAADLIVAGRAAGIEALEAALLDSGKPLLIAPSDGAPTLEGPVIVAWKDTRESAKAVSAALPFIRAARHVIVATVDDEPDPSLDRVGQQLRWHNAVETRVLQARHSDPIATIIDAARQERAGLLVMGGYGHTRMREAVFGGFTRAMLEDAPLPVLMAH